MKLNTHATFYVEDGIRVTGAVSLDDKGIFIAASCEILPNVTSAVIAEAITI